MGTKFQNDILIFVCAMPKETGKGDDTFQMQFLAFQIVLRINKSHFWNPEIKLQKKGMFL